MSFLKNISSALASLGKQKTKNYLENNTVDENSSEELEGDKIKFQPSFHSFGDRIELLAHKTIDFRNSSSPSVFYFSQGENIDNEGFWPFH